MKDTRLPDNHSDPVSYTCTCSNLNGKVLLFYRYFVGDPLLPATHTPLAHSPSQLAAFHTELTQRLNLTGKIRVSKEGFNVTVAGSTSSIEEYIEECVAHWSFAGLELKTEVERNEFFKPTPGCRCVFGGKEGEGRSIRVTEEITPMGVTNYSPSWESIHYLTPEEFHTRLSGSVEADNLILMDVRNYYESRIGYFVNARTGEKAVTPGIRRFGQWPLYVRRNLASESPSISTISSTQTETQTSGSNNEVMNEGIDQGEKKGKQYLTYCTGGIRCEKGARFLSEYLANFKPFLHSESPKDKVYTLKGGIAAYLTWMDIEISCGRKKASESLFKGRNYVFDARGSTGLSEDVDDEEFVSECHQCQKKTANLGKCTSVGCHLVLVVCDDCSTGDVWCCEDCAKLDCLPTAKGEKPSRRAICECELLRESQLWGSRSTSTPKEKSPQLVQRKSNKVKNKNDSQALDIRVKIIE
jgi:predicted sulfurtransferase